MPSLINTLSAQQQTGRTITGTVIDELGESVIGASVVEKETTNGTATDINGNFSLRVKEGATLVVSFVGYNMQEIRVESASHYSIILKENTQLLEEVVVVAYGQQKKVSVTGAISTIQMRELKQSPAANLSASLAGRLPGLAAIQTTGRPGANDAVALYLRGVATMNGTQPLIMIDGVPRDDVNLLSTLDPNEIASASILKDASATAVFGVKGANGVILITTRRGQTGKAELSISADYSLQQFTVMPEHLHSYTYAELQNEAARNTPGSDLPFTDYMIRKYRDGSDPIFYPDRNLIKEFYSPAAPQLRLNTNMSGGTEALRYFINVGYIGQGSNFKTVYNTKYDFDPAFKMDRYNFRGNLDFDATKNLKISLNLASYLQKANAPNFYKVGFGDVDGMINEALSFIMGADPTQPGPLTVGGTYTPDGTPVPAGMVTLQMPSPRSAYGVLNGYGYSWESRATLNSSLTVEWKLPFITQGLSAKALIAYDSEGSESSDGSLVVNYVQYQIGREEGEKSYYIMPNVDRYDPLVLYKASSGKYYADMQFMLNYDRLFDKHAVTGMVLAQRENHDNWGGEIPFNVLSLSSRFTYNYDNRYLAEINMGYNGSEQFAPTNRFGFFPALSAGWVISNESFNEGNHLLTNLKLRASYGKVGNDKTFRYGEELRFIYLDDIQSASGGLPSLGRTGGSAIFYNLYGNPGMQWEEAWKQNYGLDFQLWGELSLTADVFFENRSKILIERESVPDVLGVPSSIFPRMNMGIVKNRGFELELAWQKIFSKDFSVNTRANFGFNRNQIIETDEPLLGEDYYHRYRKTGFTIGQPFGYMIDYSNGNGYINTQEELDNLPTYNIGGDPRLGDFMYKDMNHDEVIDTKDQVPLGYSGVPEITYGWSASMNWNNLDLSFLLQGISHVSMAYPGFRWNEPALQHAWTKDRYESGEKIQYPALDLTNSSPSYTTNSFFLLDRSFLRLKTAEIGYTLPADRTKKVGISRMRVYVNGNNLLTFTPMKARYNDPEQDSPAKFPLAKMINFGINVTF
ncbi:MAG: TonB-dependent receptor [Dysgonamonadaceae bacterium]|nr:TonB-dependent receptor [Dysgonamonadaceae bacterium]